MTDNEIMEVDAESQDTELEEQETETEDEKLEEISKQDSQDNDEHKDQDELDTRAPEDLMSTIENSEFANSAANVDVSNEDIQSAIVDVISNQTTRELEKKHHEISESNLTSSSMKTMSGNKAYLIVKRGIEAREKNRKNMAMVSMAKRYIALARDIFSHATAHEYKAKVFGSYKGKENALKLVVDAVDVLRAYYGSNIMQLRKHIEKSQVIKSSDLITKIRFNKLEIRSLTHQINLIKKAKKYLQSADVNDNDIQKESIKWSQRQKETSIRLTASLTQWKFLKTEIMKIYKCLKKSRSISDEDYKILEQLVFDFQTDIAIPKIDQKTINNIGRKIKELQRININKYSIDDEDDVASLEKFTPEEYEKRYVQISISFGTIGKFAKELYNTVASSHTAEEYSNNNTTPQIVQAQAYSDVIMGITTCAIRLFEILSIPSYLQYLQDEDDIKTNEAHINYYKAILKVEESMSKIKSDHHEILKNKIQAKQGTVSQLSIIDKEYDFISKIVAANDNILNMYHQANKIKTSERLYSQYDEQYDYGKVIQKEKI